MKYDRLWESAGRQDEEVCKANFYVLLLDLQSFVIKLLDGKTMQNVHVNKQFYQQKYDYKSATFLPCTEDTRSPFYRFF